ncbi:helix-turn-helix transcriptional regulator [Fusibacter bizertensis]|uniref:Helix-turn-helix transcriptional regulator n=1 Tax=Fusibacter bizertensis TaxID=1488331 RepID=A0ABT6NAS4_9FIRM|nr:helix-turn-helix transcriptional regulator [Fusibacter bizertensis]MDH8677511.1 helix-turn-helix transcriptional regulator [Fusibacter bizertensis]
MLSSYDLTSFSKRLKTIRKSLGYSQNDVADETGVNSDTLRRLENGMSVPRFDTLEVLSRFYKENLILLLDSYKISTELSYFYDLVDYHMVNEDIESLRNSIKTFHLYIKQDNLRMVDAREVEQLDYFFQGLELSYNANDHSSTELFEKALKLTITHFKLDNWSHFKYNFLEIRILLSLAAVQGNLRNCELSTSILNYILNYLDPSPHSKFYEKVLIVKCYGILAYNYHRLDNHKQAIKYSDLGIQFCIDHSILSNLHFVLFRKGVALYNLNDKSYEIYIEQAINLLKIQEKHALSNTVQKYLDTFRENKRS